NNRFIYSCRLLDYDQAFNVDEVLIEPFDRWRIRTFLRRHVPEVADALYKRILDDDSLEEMVSNPFFLQALAYIYSSPPSAVGHRELLVDVPRTRGELIRTFIETLLHREAEQKQREQLQSAGGLETLKRFLGELAFHMQQRREGGTSAKTEALRG